MNLSSASEQEFVGADLSPLAAEHALLGRLYYHQVDKALGRVFEIIVKKGELYAGVAFAAGACLMPISTVLGGALANSTGKRKSAFESKFSHGGLKAFKYAPKVQQAYSEDYTTYEAATKLRAEKKVFVQNVKLSDVEPLANLAKALLETPAQRSKVPSPVSISDDSEGSFGLDSEGSGSDGAEVSDLLPALPDSLTYSTSHAYLVNALFNKYKYFAFSPRGGSPGKRIVEKRKRKITYQIVNPGL